MFCITCTCNLLYQWHSIAYATVGMGQEEDGCCLTNDQVLTCWSSMASPMWWQALIEEVPGDVSCAKTDLLSISALLLCLDCRWFVLLISLKVFIFQLDHRILLLVDDSTKPEI